QILADDKMEGRNTGSEGYRKAAAYVAGEFEKFGLKPAGVRGFYQPIEFRVRQIQELQSELDLVQDGKSERLSLSDDANFGQPAMSLADPKLDDAAGMKVSIRINPEHADKFFAGSGHSVSELLKLADNNQPLPKFPLRVAIRARAAVKRTNVTSMNIAGLLEG